MLFADSDKLIQQGPGVVLYYNKETKRWTVDKTKPELERRTFKKLDKAQQYYEKTVTPPESPRSTGSASTSPDPSPNSRWRQAVAALRNAPRR